jgi:hypothetical protein
VGCVEEARRAPVRDEPTRPPVGINAARLEQLAPILPLRVPVCAKNNTLKITLTAIHEIHFCLDCAKSFVLSVHPHKKPQ